MSHKSASSPNPDLMCDSCGEFAEIKKKTVPESGREIFKVERWVDHKGRKVVCCSSMACRTEQMAVDHWKKMQEPPAA